MGVEEIELWRIGEPRNPLRREANDDGIEDLARSIGAHGLLNPLTVRRAGAGFEVVAGHRRLLALRKLGVSHVQCQVLEPSVGDVVVVAAAENLIRRDMSVSDEGRVVAALMGREGWGIGSCARALNRSEGWVRDRLDVLQWPEEVVGGISGGRISLGAAKALMGVRDERARSRLIGYALSSGVSVEVAKRWRDLENLGEGVTDQSASLAVGVEVVQGELKARTKCFLCGEVSYFGELVYVWVHRECAVQLEADLREAAAAAAGAPPGGGVGVPAPAGDGA